MHWSTVRFGKYEGKTLPKIIVLDFDWFFLDAPKVLRPTQDRSR